MRGGWGGARGGAKGQFDRASKETSTVRWKTGWREVREVKKVRRSEGRCVCGGKHTHINPSGSEIKGRLAAEQPNLILPLERLKETTTKIKAKID